MACPCGIQHWKCREICKKIGAKNNENNSKGAKCAEFKSTYRLHQRLQREAREPFPPPRTRPSAVTQDTAPISNFADFSQIFSRKFPDFLGFLQNVADFCEISAKINKILTQICKISEIRMVQKDANLVDLEKCRKMRLFSIS